MTLFFFQIHRPPGPEEKLGGRRGRFPSVHSAGAHQGAIGKVSTLIIASSLQSNISPSVQTDPSRLAVRSGVRVAEGDGGDGGAAHDGAAARDGREGHE